MNRLATGGKTPGSEILLQECDHGETMSLYAANFAARIRNMTGCRGDSFWGRDPNIEFKLLFLLLLLQVERGGCYHSCRLHERTSLISLTFMEH
jgi:hypothetical protein